MKYLIIFLLFFSCKPQEKTTQDSAKSPVYYHWNVQGIQEAPLHIVLSKEFVPLVSVDQPDPSGLNAIEKLAKKWNDSHPVLEFFDLPFTIGENKIYTNLEDYLEDGEMGIYYSSGWYRELSPSALAVTQFIGIRKNTGTPDEYLELVHGDILVNFRDFEYFTDSNPKTFDLQTVLLHEMGHLLGLQHVYNPSITSVMSPYLDRGEKRRDLTQFDFENILKHYPIINPQKSGISSLLNIEESGKLERHIVELFADGTCKHYLNGQLIKSHK